MMAMKRTAVVSTLLLGAIVLAGCYATAIKPLAPQVVYKQRSDLVQRAALDAMVVNGFVITKMEPLYIEGRRPRTHGMFCSPGGETTGIWLEQVESTQTRMWISTAISSFGRWCQKDWTVDILAEMEKELNKSK